MSWKERCRDHHELAQRIAQDEDHDMALKHVINDILMMLGLCSTEGQGSSRRLWLNAA